MKYAWRLWDDFSGFYDESGSAYLRIKAFPLFEFDGLIDYTEWSYDVDYLASSEYEFEEITRRRNLEVSINEEDLMDSFDLTDASDMKTFEV